jgi:hypothetical protein
MDDIDMILEKHNIHSFISKIIEEAKKGNDVSNSSVMTEALNAINDAMHEYHDISNNKK